MLMYAAIMVEAVMLAGNMNRESVLGALKQRCEQMFGPGSVAAQWSEWLTRFSMTRKLAKTYIGVAGSVLVPKILGSAALVIRDRRWLGRSEFVLMDLDRSHAFFAAHDASTCDQLQSNCAVQLRGPTDGKFQPPSRQQNIDP